MTATKQQRQALAGSRADTQAGVLQQRSENGQVPWYKLLDDDAFVFGQGGRQEAPGVQSLRPHGVVDATGAKKALHERQKLVAVLRLHRTHKHGDAEHFQRLQTGGPHANTQRHKHVSTPAMQ